MDESFLSDIASATNQFRGDSRNFLVETKSLSLRFGKQTILNDISISIPRGQTLAIIGESGCG